MVFFLGNPKHLNARCRIVIGSQKGTVILRAYHMGLDPFKGVMGMF